MREEYGRCADRWIIDEVVKRGGEPLGVGVGVGRLDVERGARSTVNTRLCKTGDGVVQETFYST